MRWRDLVLTVRLTRRARAGGGHSGWREVSEPCLCIYISDDDVACMCHVAVVRTLTVCYPHLCCGGVQGLQHRLRSLSVGICEWITVLWVHNPCIYIDFRDFCMLSCNVMTDTALLLLYYCFATGLRRHLCRFDNVMTDRPFVDFCRGS